MPNFNLLKSDEGLQCKFVISLLKKFEIFDRLATTEERWERMKECSNDTIAELFPKVTSKVHKRWVTQDMMELDGRAEKCKEWYCKVCLTRQDDREKMQQSNRNSYTSQYQEVENNSLSNSNYMHQKIKDGTGLKWTTKSRCVKSKTGDKDDIFKRWSENIEYLFYDTRGPPPIIVNVTEDPTILVEEVKHALSKMKRGKATCPGGILTEVIIT